MAVGSIPSAAGRPRTIVIATRKSALAMWQAQHVRLRLLELYRGLDVTLLGLTTEGDRRRTAPLATVGGKGLFIKELEEALARRQADIAVHSMKDVPVRLAPGFTLAAITERADPRDAFVSNRSGCLADLADGARVGTSSLRRASQLRSRHPRLEVVPLRGNVSTRLRKLDEGRYDAIILAAAGLKRLGLEHRITALLAPEESLPAVGQGALAIECLSERTDLLELLAPLNHRATALCVAAERAFSCALAGSCNVPLAGFAEMSGGRLRLRGFVGAPDGSRAATGEIEGPADEPQVLGEALAQELRVRGAAEILAALGSAPEFR